MRRISARISRRSLASRFESGSSISTSGGSMTMARAMATRCCWPPESWPGSLSPWPSSRTRPSASSTRALDLGLGRRRASQGRSRYSCARSYAGTARSSGTPCRSRAPPAAAGRCGVSSSQIAPPVSGQQPGDAVERRRLAAAGGAEQGDELAPLDRRGSMSRSALSVPKSRLRRSSRSVAGNGARHRHGAMPSAAYLRFAGADLLVPDAGRRRPAGRARAAARSGCSAISCSYSGRPNSLIASWLSCGAMASVHVLHRRAGIEIALVVGVGLLLLAEQEAHQVEQHGELLVRHALRDAHVMGVRDPVEALERRRPCASFGTMPRTRGLMSQPVVETIMSRDALAELLHRRAGAGRVVLDVLAELLEIGPGLVPALHRVLRIAVAEDVGQAHQEGAAGAGIGRARIDEAVRVLPWPRRAAPRPSSAASSPGPACIRAAGRTGSR